MTGTIIAGVALVCALIPAVLYARNVRLYRTPGPPQLPLPTVSVLIPARNEAAAIAACVESVLATHGMNFEIIVLDDHSEDDTAAIVRKIAAHEPRLRLEKAPPLPAGWCGKQHACFALAKLARHPVLCFLDADVRLAPAGLPVMVGFMESSGADLVSGFPHQQAESFLERLVIPLIHFLLLGFLPLRRMQRSRKPQYGAGCGQLFVVKRSAYEKSGGHEAIKASLHDGLTLPRAFRKHGFATDLCDATYLAECRMYRSGRELWAGLAKNATEGLASRRLLIPATLMLLAGQVLPVCLLLYYLSRFAILVYFQGGNFGLLMTAFEQSGLGAGLALSSLGTLAMYYPRFDSAQRFRQSTESAFLHPMGISALLAIQWCAAIKAVFRRPREWKGRRYPQRDAASGDVG